MSGKAWFSQTIRRWFVDPAYKGEGYGWKMAAQIADRLDTAPPEIQRQILEALPFRYTLQGEILLTNAMHFAPKTPLFWPHRKASPQALPSASPNWKRSATKRQSLFALRSTGKSA